MGAVFRSGKCGILARICDPRIYSCGITDTVLNSYSSPTFY